MKLKLRSYKAVAILVITGIVGFQAYWLHATYRQAEAQTLKEINTALKGYVLETMVNRFSATAGLGAEPSASGPRTQDLVRGLARDLTRLSNSPGYDVSLTIIDKKKQAASPLSRDSIRALTNDLHKRIQEVLRRNNIAIPYDVVVTNGPDPAATSGRSAGDGRELRSEGFELNGSPLFFHIRTAGSFPYLIRQMKLSILFSLCLILLSVLVFAVFLKTISRQVRFIAYRNDFVNNITHELKTPLATCSAALEAIDKFRMIDDKATTLQYVTLAQAQIERMKTLADLILTSSAAESDGLTYRFDITSLEQLISDAVAGFDLQLKERGITLSTGFAGQPLFVLADRLHLSQVISNVLDNAIKYNLQGGSITLRAERAGRQIKIRVSNTGSGFAKDYAQKVFDKFFRVPTNDVHAVRGYGLGLNYAKHVIEAHQGSISITSAVNDVTTLTMLLPAHDA